MNIILFELHWFLNITIHEYYIIQLRWSLNINSLILYYSNYADPFLNSRIFYYLDYADHWTSIHEYYIIHIILILEHQIHEYYIIRITLILELQFMNIILFELRWSLNFNSRILYYLNYADPWTSIQNIILFELRGSLNLNSWIFILFKLR